ncbi:MAG: RNA-binding protein, partial [Polaromonas sp.]|nr:RNA-binding protein [Polaromonas sp.]
MTEPVRLAKRLAAQLGCSRREAEQYIEGGWVRVDGVVVEEPQARVLDQRIELDADASLLAAGPVSILLHKPPGFVAGSAAGPATAPAPKSAPGPAPKSAPGAAPKSAPGAAPKSA